MSGDETVRMWRCTACGKWSHARRRPKHHERLTTDWQVAETSNVLREESGGGGPDIWDAWWLACGPFEEWQARRQGATP